MSTPLWFMLKILAEVVYEISQGVDKNTAISKAAQKYNLKEDEIRQCL